MTACRSGRCWKRILVWPILVVILGACGRPDGLEVGLNEVHTNVVFGAASKDAPPPALESTSTVLVSRTPAPSFIAPPPVVSVAPAPAPQPPKPPVVACPSADLYQVPSPAGTEIVGQPVSGVYPFSQAGSFQRKGQQPVSLPSETERTIRDLATTSDGGYRYQQVVEQFGAKTTTAYQFVKAAKAPQAISKNGDTRTDGIYLASVMTQEPDGTIERFEPASPGLKIFPTPAELGLLWNSVAVDAVHSAAMKLTGSIRERFRIDACGDLVEGWRSEVVIEVTTPDSKYVVSADYIVIPDLGGLIGADKVELSGSYHGVEVKQSSTSTIKRLSPVRPPAAA
jgi:hypothetical protein